MIKIIIKYILVISLIISNMSGVIIAENTSNNLEKMSGVAENSELKLYLDEDTLELAVKTKKTGDIWYSNPADRDRKEQVLRGSSRDILKSQFIIHYYDRLERRRRMNNYVDSIENDQYELSKIDNGIRITYTLGDIWTDESYLPSLIDKEQFEEQVIKKVEDERDKELLLEYFTLFQLTDDGRSMLEMPGIDDPEEVFGNNRVEILGGGYLEDREEITSLEKELANLKEQKENNEKDQSDIEEEISNLESQINRLRRSYNEDKIDLTWNVIDRFRTGIDDLERLDQVKLQHLKPLIDNPTYVLEDIPRYLEDDIFDIIQSTGFSPENVQQAHINYNINIPTPNIEIFEIPVEYFLDGENFVARIPVNEIYYPWEVEEDDEVYSFPLTSIDFMPFFGAANNEQEGYMFVPDGSGALINLNTDKRRRAAPGYEKTVYGHDNIFIRETQEVSNPKISLPVFGLKQGDKAFLGIIEEGDALATINADIAGRTSSYNSVYANFITLTRGEAGLGIDADEFGALHGVGRDAGTIGIYHPEIYQGDIKIRYAFLDNVQADYVGMAKYYQNYLVENDELEKMNAKEKIPMFLELLGGINVRRPQYGFVRETIEPLTTFSQAQEILNILQDKGIDNLNLKYSGWLEGGIRHSYPSNIKIEDKLGSEKGFKGLIDFLNENNINLFPDVSFINVYRDNNFNPKNYASRQPNRLIAKIYEYDVRTNSIMEDDMYNYILSPSYLGELVNQFGNQYTNYNINNISFSHLGSQLNSDFRTDKERVVNRQQAAEKYRKSLFELSNKFDLNTMVNEGAAYLFPYTNNIVNMPLSSSDYNLIDRTVPFYQIVLNGYVNYSGKPINLMHKPHIYKLKLMEFGAAPYFKLFYEDPQKIRDSEYNYLHSAHFKNFKDEMASFYDEFNNLYNKVKTANIINHKKLTNDVYKTTYSNGIAVIVNYNGSQKEINGISIDGEDYTITQQEVSFDEY